MIDVILFIQVLVNNKNVQAIQSHGYIWSSQGWSIN